MEFKKKKILIFLPAGVGGAERVGIAIGKMLTGSRAQTCKMCGVITLEYFGSLQSSFTWKIIRRCYLTAYDSFGLFRC